MIFQTLDDKKECVGVYWDGNLRFDEMPENMSKTWSYSNFLENRDIEYASIYCLGKSIDDICPSHLCADWEKVTERLKAFMRANKIAKVSLEENCFFDLAPQRFLKEYCEVKNKICEWVFQNYERPKNYDHLLKIQRVLADIKYKKVKFEEKELLMHWHENKAKVLHSKFKGREAYCNYNLFGSITGRLTLHKHSLPILNMKKEYRAAIKPNNDFFIELDYNAAEARVVLSLLGLEQPSQDIHEYHAKNLYHCSRVDAKKRFFAWLYNPNSEDSISSQKYDRSSILKKYRTHNSVETIFGRNIKCGDFHAFNYLIQSTCADMVLDRMVEIHNILKGRKSYVAFTLHDSVILDFHSEDKELIRQLIEEYRNTKLGNFKTTISAGKDLYNLDKIDI